MTKFYIVAGEASGDMHGANLVKAIKSLDSRVEFRAWGGDRLESEGALIQKHYRELAFMGFVEVAKNIRTILNNIKQCKQEIKDYDPDALILIDYPGFNMRIADFAKKEGYKVFYYISPQVWAWKKNRVFKLKKSVDRMYTILPFEKAFYAGFDMDVDYVGHPLLDEIAQRKINIISSDKEILVLLPGSRKQEIKKMLPQMYAAVKDKNDYQIIIAQAPSIPEEFYSNIINTKKVKLIANQTYDLLSSAKLALVTSGTATLETALFEVPQIVCYKGNWISYFIAKNLVDIKFISLVNLIMDKEIVKELIQKECNPQNISREFELLETSSKQSEIKENYGLLKSKLGNSGASKLTAELMLKKLKAH